MNALSYPDETDDPMWYMQLSLDCRDAVRVLLGETQISERRKRQIVYNLTKLGEGLLSEVTDAEMHAALEASERLAAVIRQYRAGMARQAGPIL